MVKQGDIILMNFNPQSGREQAGKRPALVVSNESFWLATGRRFAMMCPITSTVRNLPLHIPLDSASKTTGFVMCEQVKVLDIKSRGYKKVDEISDAVLDDVLSIIADISTREKT